MMKYYFIINPKAGKKHGDIVSVIKDAAGRHEWTYDFTRYAGHASELASEAVKQGYSAIIAAGGDGTIQETARGIFGKNVKFGLLPCGSGNGLARNLAIPLNVKSAAEGVFRWEARPVDAGLANGKLFLVSCGVGLDADVAHCFNSQSHGRGILPYVWHSLHIYFTYKPKVFNAEIDGEKCQLGGLVLTAMVGEQYGGGAKIAPMAAIDDGYLDLCSVKPVGTLRLLRYLPGLFNATLHKHPDIYKDIRCRKALLEYGKPFWFHLDGEDFFCEEGRIAIQIQDKAFNMIRP